MEVTPTSRDFRPWMQDRKFFLVLDPKEYDDLIDECCSVDRYGFDTETDGLHPTKSRIVGICLSPDPKRGYYIPLRHLKGKNFDLDRGLGGLSRLSDSEGLNDMYNAQFDLQMAANDNIYWDWNNIRDAQISWWLIDSSRKLRGGLKAIAKQFFDYQMIELWELFFNKKPDKKANFDPRVHTLDPMEVTVYGSSDAIVTTELERVLEKDRWWIRQEKINQMEMATVECLRIRERGQLQLDVPYYKRWNERIERDMAECEVKIYSLAGRPFNISANKQLARVLYKQLGLPCTKTTGKREEPAVDEEALTAIRSQHPIVPVLQEWKTLQKQHSTYLVPFLSGFDENGETRCGYFHPATETGRIQGRKGGKGFKIDGKLAMSITTIPKNKDSRPDIYDPRRGIIAHKGFKLVAVDYANEEVRLAANMSGEDNWIEALLNGENMHRRMASLMYEVSMDEVTPEQYASAKAANFKYLYGGGSPKEEIYRLYYAAVPKLKKWQDGQKEQMKNYGHVKSAWGRIRRAEALIKSGDWGSVQYALRQSVNAPVQMSGADVLRLALIEVLLRKVYGNKGAGKEPQYPELRPWVHVRLLIHDEICYEIAEDETLKGSEAWEKGWTFDKIVYMICETMESITCLGWKVPLLVDGHANSTWSSVGARGFKLDRENRKIIWEEPKSGRGDLQDLLKVDLIKQGVEVWGVFWVSRAFGRAPSQINKIKQACSSALAENGNPLMLEFEDGLKTNLPKRYDLHRLRKVVEGITA